MVDKKKLEEDAKKGLNVTTGYLKTGKTHQRRSKRAMSKMASMKDFRNVMA